MRTEQEKKERVTNFSSSNIYMLTKNGRAKDSIGAPFYTYIEEKLIEHRLGRALDKDHSARPTTWGIFVERFAFELLGLEYKLVSKDRYYHKTISHWSGAPDLLSEDNIVGDIKCPFTLKSFCQIVNKLEISNNIAEDLKEIKEEYYWQLVSNAILTQSTYADLVLFVPYKEQLQEIRDYLNNEYNGDDIHKYFWIDRALDEELPYLIKGNYYNNIHAYRFEVPQEDIDFLESRVKLASEKLEELING